MFCTYRVSELKYILENTIKTINTVYLSAFVNLSSLLFDAPGQVSPEIENKFTLKIYVYKTINLANNWDTNLGCRIYIP